ncbi:MAG: HlyD family type I secretion periplasmic adaptor subunit [Rhodospirillales bacterium]|nr:HlyD family type I secretion periplasmic adaptor subunit [Rhodospirillales bacterium]
MSRLDDLLVHHPIPSWRPVAWPVMILLTILLIWANSAQLDEVSVATGEVLTILLIWANSAQLDEVSVATGEVVPLGNIKVIQHLEGGIIKEIHVKEGDVITEGQELILLDLASSGVNREELVVRLDSLILTGARLEAEAKGRDSIRFPKEVAARRPQVVSSQRQAFDARRRQISSSQGILKQLVRQRQLEVSELTAKLRATEKNLKLARGRFEMSKSLLADGLTPKIEHSKVEAEVETLEGERQSILPSIPRSRSAVSEAKGRLEEEVSRFRREAQDELGDTIQNIGRVRELLSKATEQGLRAMIKSPINGVVKNMRYNTIGGVVSPGEAIMEVVPTGDQLVIDARLKPTDRGYVEAGQPATVKISTYDFVRYGGLEGTVSLVAPDSSTDEQGNPYFRLVVETSKAYLGDAEGKLPIMPGMEATVDVHTGTKSVMDYLIKPVLKLRHEAFRER